MGTVDEPGSDTCACFRSGPPVFDRYLRRTRGQPLGPITEEEKQDAIRVMKDQWLWAMPIYDEAEKIFLEASE